MTVLHLGAREAAVATAVLTLADSLGLYVVAEGVELQAQAGMPAPGAEPALS